MPTFIPEITKAYENDPRTKLAQVLVQNGANTAPVAGGKWAWADGIARALSGVAGGYAQHKQQQKYEQREQDMTNAVANALGGGAAAPGGMVPPQGVQAGGGGAPPVQAQPPAPAMVPPPPQNNAPDPLAPLPPQGAPQGLPPPPIAQAPQAAPAAPQEPSPASQALPAAPQIAAALGGGGAAHPAAPFLASSRTAPVLRTPTATPGTNVTGASMVLAMLPITRSTESNGQDFTQAGKPTTSVKGAKYAMQVMPATARKPGFGIRPAANDSPEEYNRVGTELLGKLTEKYGGDPSKAWAAYNGGTGRVDHALAKHGDAWLQHMPAETQAYVQKNVAALGNTDPSQGRYYPDTQQAELKPTGPTQYQTAAPAPTALPERPADRGAAKSYRMASGQKLLSVRDPALFQRAMEMLDTGMGEQFAADRDALSENNKRDDTLYNAGIDDHYTANNQARAAAYDARGDERREGFTFGREMRGYAHEDNTNATNRQFEAGENALNRAQQEKLTNMQIEGKHEDARIKQQQRMQSWLNTPQGSRMYQQSTDTMKTNDDITNQINAFMELNEQHPGATGGFLMNSPPEWIARNMSSSTQAMDAITQKIAPIMRQAGQGSMSDKDLAGFVRSVPNIKNNVDANRLGAKRLKAGMARINDFELQKLQAASEGRQIEFLKEWNTYKNTVPFEKELSFDDWKNGNTYKADGSRQ